MRKTQPTANLLSPLTSSRALQTTADSKKLLDSLRQGDTDQPGSRELPPMEAREQLFINQFFTRMSNTYGHLFMSQFKSDRQTAIAQRDWMKAFKNARLTPKVVDKTIDYLQMNVPNMPNVPTFIDYAKSTKLLFRDESEGQRQALALPASKEEAEDRKVKAHERHEKRRADGQQPLAALKQMLGL